MELAIDQSRTLGVSGTGGKTIKVGGQTLPIFGSTGAATGGSSALLASTLGGLAAGSFSSKTVGLTLTNTEADQDNFQVFLKPNCDPAIAAFAPRRKSWTTTSAF